MSSIIGKVFNNFFDVIDNIFFKKYNKEIEVSKNILEENNHLLEISHNQNKVIDRHFMESKLALEYIKTKYYSGEISELEGYEIVHDIVDVNNWYCHVLNDSVNRRIKRISENYNKINNLLYIEDKLREKRMAV
jgi:hypothetical protein